MAADIKLADCLIAPHRQPCWDCANACGGCSWSARGEPIPGWKAEPVIIRNHLDRGPENFSAKSFKIYACPQFTRG